jgi:hypothetical protein
MAIIESTIEDALRAADIELLIEYGAPQDEYTPEISGIVNALAIIGEKEIDIERLVAIIREVWVQMFGPFSDEEIELRMPAFRQVAHRILARDSGSSGVRSLGDRILPSL